VAAHRAALAQVAPSTKVDGDQALLGPGRACRRMPSARRMTIA
jgi:hypothetical protein